MDEIQQIFALLVVICALTLLMIVHVRSFWLVNVWSTRE